MADRLLRAGVMPVSVLLRLRLLAGSMACCLAACGSEPAPAARTAPLETAAAESAVEPGPTATATPASVTPPTVTPSVGAPPDAIALLAPEARAALAASPVPMLVLPADRARATTILTGEHWTALHFRDDALTISLHATDVSHPVVGDDEVAHLPPPPDTVRGRPARVLFNEQIRSVAWEEGPVSYALEVECAQPFEDTRCTEPDFVLELADALVAAPRSAR